jgi:hypothetical protein
MCFFFAALGDRSGRARQGGHGKTCWGADIENGCKEGSGRSGLTKERWNFALRRRFFESL